MLVDLQVGPRGLTDGTTNEIRGDKTGALVTTDAHGRYQEATLRTNTFVCSASPAAVAFGATIAATTSAALINPIASGVNVVILGVSIILTTAPALGTAIVLAASSTLAPTITGATGFVTRALNLSTAVSVVIGTTAAGGLTGTPTALFPLLVASAITAAVPAVYVDLGGLVVVPPGGSIGINCIAASSGFVSYLFEQVAI